MDDVQEDDNSLGGGWMISSKQELYAAIEKYKDAQFSLFIRFAHQPVPVIEHANKINSPDGMYLFMADKHIVGFLVSEMTGPVDRLGDTHWTFIVGNAIYNFYIEL